MKLKLFQKKHLQCIAPELSPSLNQIFPRNLFDLRQISILGGGWLCLWFINNRVLMFAAKTVRPSVGLLNLHYFMHQTFLRHNCEWLTTVDGSNLHFWHNPVASRCVLQSMSEKFSDFVVSCEYRKVHWMNFVKYLQFDTLGGFFFRRPDFDGFSCRSSRNCFVSPLFARSNFELSILIDGGRNKAGLEEILLKVEPFAGFPSSLWWSRFFLNNPSVVHCFMSCLDAIAFHLKLEFG